MRTKILYKDEHIIVAYKPAGLAVQTAKVGQQDMVSELKNDTGQPYLGVVHRLDQPVEGVLVFGRTKAATADLSRQLSQGILNKRYLAVVCGQPPAGEGELEDYLRRSADGRAEIAGPGEPDAKRAILRYRIAAEGDFEKQESPDTEKCDGDVTIYLADIRIETGRFHQIRAQMAHAGMPLLGDLKYRLSES